MSKVVLLALVLCLGSRVAPVREPVWSCIGPVSDCTSSKLKGRFGCATALGNGDSRPEAVKDALQDCADQLEGQHNAVFMCTGDGSLQCAGAN